MKENSCSSKRLHQKHKSDGLKKALNSLAFEDNKQNAQCYCSVTEAKNI